jgi:peroxiredoxin
VNQPVVRITGALTGIGCATALAFAREGAHLVVSGRRVDAGQQLAAELRSLGAKAEFVRADVCHGAEVRSPVEQKVGRFGRLDVAVNNAGTEGTPGPLAESSAEDIELRALKVGDKAPAMTLPDALGRRVALADLWRGGPLVLIFHRGGWCPYCNLELRAWQQQWPELARRDAQLAAISPQTPDHSLSTAEKYPLVYSVLSDSTLAVAEAFGIAFNLPDEFADLCASAGNDLPTLIGNGRWTLPVRATYVVDLDGRIAYAHVDADYRQRAEPALVLAAVDVAREADFI